MATAVLFFTGGPVKNKLYIQTDNLNFKDITEDAGVGGGDKWGVGAALVDIDNDGDIGILYVIMLMKTNSSSTMVI